MQSRINLPAPDAAPLGAAGTVLNVPQGADIFSQGDACDAFFRIVSGTVRICRYLGDGRRLIDAFYGEEEFFGLTLDEARLFSAEALNDCVLVSYRRSAVLAQAETDGTLARQLFHIAMQGQARARRHALLLSRRSAGEKMAGFLLHQAAGPPAHGRYSLSCWTSSGPGPDRAPWSGRSIHCRWPAGYFVPA